jgi:hypothetical protein
VGTGGYVHLDRDLGIRSKVVMDVRVLGNGDDFCPHVVLETVTITLDP